MFVKFANINGEAFDLTGSIYKPGVLGDVILYENGILIYDRFPNQQTTQMNISTMVETLRYLLSKTYALQSRRVDIYLPKMTNDMNAQANVQKTFLTMTSDDNLLNFGECSMDHGYNNECQSNKKPSNRFNINIINV